LEFSDFKKSLKSAGSRLVPIDDLTDQFDSLKAFIGASIAPEYFLIRFIGERSN